MSDDFPPDDMSVQQALGVLSIVLFIVAVFSLLIFSPLAMLLYLLAGVVGIAAVVVKIMSLRAV